MWIYWFYFDYNGWTCLGYFENGYLVILNSKEEEKKR